MADPKNPYKSALFGVAVGDAIGVPFEFQSREVIRRKPATDMIGYGTYGLPAGTWSDDSSLTFCLADALTEKFDLQLIAQNFINWRYKNLWTARGEVFDVGMATQRAIDRLVRGTRPDLAGDFEASSNGNGALMRILPLMFYIKNKTIKERFEITKQVCGITHGHIRSSIACFYYLEFAIKLLSNSNVNTIYQELKIEFTDFLNLMAINPLEVAWFDRLLKHDIGQLSLDEIRSTGYVLHTLEASVWCLLTTSNYQEAVLKAVNLGNDTDTTAAVTGGLAGLKYGFDIIPADWVLKLARKDDIEDLANKLKEKYN